MSLTILFHFLCAQNFSDINMSETSLQHGYHSNPSTPNIQHTSNQEQNNQCANSAAQSKARDGG